jgi:PST family polysaccharide transporter
MIVVGFARIFKDLGTASAVIRGKALSPALLSSIFWVNLAFGALTMLLLCAAAPAVAAFYHEPRVTMLLRVVSLTFLLSSLSILQQALLERNLAFDRLARIELVAGVTGAAAGIGAAVAGQGVWSLVYQALVVAGVTTVLLWLVGGWRPRLLFDWGEVRAVTGYSLNLTAFNVFNYVERNLDNLLIGRFLGAGALGYYALAYRLMLYPLQGVSTVIIRVLFPTYAKIQDDDARFRRIYLQVTGAIAVVTFPVFFGLMATSEPLILTIFGEEWRPVIPLILILGPVGMLQSVGTMAGAIYRAKGRTDWHFRFQLVTVSLSIPAFALGLRWGVVGVAAAYAAVMTILAYPSFAIPFSLIGLRVGALVATLWRPFASGALMALGVVSLRTMLPAAVPPQEELAAAVAAGIVLYAATSWLLNREQLRRLLDSLGARRAAPRAMEGPGRPARP